MEKGSAKSREQNASQVEYSLIEAILKRSPLPESFFLKDALTVARQLVGKGLIVGTGKQSIVTEIVEVEAYLGVADPASHSHRGLSSRNWPMFEAGGTCYIYLSYGIHYCMNVSTGEKGVGEAVLFRAARPISGIEQIVERRKSAKNVYEWLNGPGKLTAGLGVGPSKNGQTFFETGFRLVDLSGLVPPVEVVTTARIGITKAAEKPWRFLARHSPYVSRAIPARKLPTQV